MAVLSLHRDLPRYIGQQKNECWQELRVAPASTRRVGFLGLGELAQASIKRLLPSGFTISGCSRSRKKLDQVHCYAGPDEIGPFLAASDILVCLLPLTSETTNILNESHFSKLPAGASFIQLFRLADHRFLSLGEIKRLYILWIAAECL